MDLVFGNNSASTLDSGISSVDTTLELVSGGGALFPVIQGGDYGYITIVNQAGAREVIKCEGRTSGDDTLTGLTRGVDGTTALAWSAGDKVQMRIPKIIVEEMITQIETNESDISSNYTSLNNAITALDVRVTALEASTALIAPTGTRLFFHQDSPPGGWVYDTNVVDQLLSVKGGSQAYNVAGGTYDKGSWTPTGHTHTGPSHTHAAGAHTHPVAVNSHSHTGPSHTHSGPSHTHGVGSYATAQTGEWAGTGAGSDSSAETHTHTITGTSAAGGTGNTGAGGTGSTGSTAPSGTANAGSGNTGSSGTGATGSATDPSTDRPLAAVGIIAVKS